MYFIECFSLNNVPLFKLYLRMHVVQFECFCVYLFHYYFIDLCQVDTTKLWVRTRVVISAWSRVRPSNLSVDYGLLIHLGIKWEFVVFLFGYFVWLMDIRTTFEHTLHRENKYIIMHVQYRMDTTKL